MPVNGMNVGVDYTISYFEPTSGALINLGDVQEVKITQLKHELANRRYNGPTKYAYIPDGYKIDFTITRSASTLEDLMVTFESNFNQGLVQTAGSLNQTTINADGSISRYQYTNLVVFLTSHGDISREKIVTMTFEAMASTKEKIA